MSKPRGRKRLSIDGNNREPLDHNRGVGKRLTTGCHSRTTGGLVLSDDARKRFQYITPRSDTVPTSGRMTIPRTRVRDPFADRIIAIETEKINMEIKDSWRGSPMKFLFLWCLFLSLRVDTISWDTCIELRRSMVSFVRPRMNLLVLSRLFFSLVFS